MTPIYNFYLAGPDSDVSSVIKRLSLRWRADRERCKHKRGPPKMGCDVNVYTDSLSSVRKWMLFFTVIWWSSIKGEKNPPDMKRSFMENAPVFTVYCFFQVYALQSIATLAASVHIHAVEGDATISGATCLSGATSIQTNTGTARTFRHADSSCQ